MKRATLIIVAGIFVLTATIVSMAQPVMKTVAPGKVRIGTYDNRAIAVAFAASSHNPAGEKMKALKEAKTAGDKAKVAELEAWGKSYQRQLHFQGFGHVPVGDLLAPVKDGVARIAAEQNLTAIVMECDYAAANVETVDVTDALVALFDPSEKTLNSARMIRTVEPIPLVKLADLPAEH
ncbi:MAG: hypothetical protein H6818_05680 [Phycisphaerales bacterium]|nr:hypothetical protein [Phycisphaerales bacterium]MCB9862753.1 hypothetical protein [Phycisphaerales bacterium]